MARPRQKTAASAEGVPVAERLGDGPMPLYYQLEQRLRDRIASEELTPGSVLPTEDQLCGQYGVSRITVRRALDALLSQGLITRRHGVGSFVAERTGMNSRLTGSLGEFLTSAARLRTCALSLGSANAPAEVCNSLGLPPGAQATLLRTVGALDEEGPVAYLEIWFPVDIGARLTRADVDGCEPVVRAVERLLGQRVVRAEQVVEPDYAGVAAAHLGVSSETPILRVKRVYYNSADRPIEAAYVRYHPQRYRYAIDFRL